MDLVLFNVFIVSHGRVDFVNFKDKIEKEKEKEKTQTLQEVIM